MTQYLLSLHRVDGDAGERMTDEEMQQSYARVGALNEELRSSGAWVFGGRLHDPQTATVVQMSNGEVLTTDGPFAESKEHVAGFYIIEAQDLDAALAWASKATAAVGRPIEVRPFWDAEAYRVTRKQAVHNVGGGRR
jgi:hypothetical protein